jgi:acyl-CoA thioesterase
MEEARHDEVPFDELVSPVARGEGRFSVDVPDGWQQGRGAFGGLVLAMLARAAEAAAADPGRALRSLSGQIVGPVQPGAADVAVEVLRAGSGVTAVAARLVQEGAVQAHAVVTLGKSRATFAAAPTMAPPAARPWRELAPIPVSVPLAPTFTRHVEFWPTGGLPFSGGTGAEVAGWVRFRSPGRRRDAALAVALIDAYWPAFLVTAAAPRPAATLTFSLETLSDLDGLDPAAPLFHRGRVLGGRDGYAIEARELWGEDGRLVALNQQIFVVIK